MKVLLAFLIWALVGNSLVYGIGHYFYDAKKFTTVDLITGTLCGPISVMLVMPPLLDKLFEYVHENNKCILGCEGPK